MALWRWLLGLFRRKPARDPLPAEERHVRDNAAANAARAAEAGIYRGGGPSA